LRDLDRWEERGLEGLADETAPGNPPRITGEAGAFMEHGLSEEERTWNATRLQEVLEERFEIGVTPEAVRQHLLAMGYRWKRTRYVPARLPAAGPRRGTQSPSRPREELKKGHERASTS
jgi:transposase